MTWFLLTMLSAFLWALINVFNSTLVARHEKNPFVLLWVQTCISVVFLSVLAMIFPVRSSWMPVFLAAALVGYGGDVLFFWILNRIEVSVVNAAWPILAIFLSIGGFVFFHESWSLSQGAGAALVIVAILALSFFHTHVSLKRTLFLLSSLALLFAPIYLVRKAALLAGVPIFPVFFWLILGRDVPSFVVPLVVPSIRRDLFRAFRTLTPSFYLISAFVITCFFCGEYVITQAYLRGPISLVTVVGNIQPFFVVALSWLTHLLWPSMAPFEGFTKRSLCIKAVCFGLAFVGLALLSIPQ